MSPAELRALSVALEVAGAPKGTGASWYAPRPRDSYREKLYRAERLAFPDRDLDARKIDLAECRILAGRALEWAKRVGLTPPERRLHFIIADGRGCRNATAAWGGSADGWRITLPKWGRTPSVVLHEVAHCLQPAGSAWHGWQFAAIFVALVEEFMGEGHARRLRDAFTAGGVRFRRPRPGIPLTPERRAALVAQLAAARLARAAEAPPAGEGAE